MGDAGGRKELAQSCPLLGVCGSRYRQSRLFDTGKQRATPIRQSYNTAMTVLLGGPFPFVGRESFARSEAAALFDRGLPRVSIRRLGQSGKSTPMRGVWRQRAARCASR